MLALVKISTRLSLVLSIFCIGNFGLGKVCSWQSSFAAKFVLVAKIVTKKDGLFKVHSLQCFVVAKVVLGKVRS